MQYNDTKSMYAVEVTIKQHVWVQGYAKSGNDEGLTVEFDNYPTGNYFYHQLRVPNTTTGVQDIEVGQEIEVPVKIDGTELIGWTKCNVDKIRGEFFSVSGREGTNPSYTKEEIRVVGKNKSMDAKGAAYYHYANIKVPQGLRESVMEAENVDKLVHGCSQRISILFDEATGCLNLITPNVDDLNNVVNIADFHFQFMRTEQKLNSKLVSVQCRLPHTENFKPGTIVEEFSVAKSLMCHTIGARGFNIDRARNVKGVNRIFVDDETSTIRIFGTSLAAVAEARALTEYVEEVIPVEKSLIPKIIGTKGDNFQKIVDRSDVRRMFVHYCENDKIYELHVIGTKKNVESAIIMLKFVIRNVQDFEVKMVQLNQLRDKCRELQSNPRIGSKSSEGARSDQDVEDLPECAQRGSNPIAENS